MSNTFGAAEFRAAAGADDRQMADLEAFRSMLIDWNGRMNLVGPSTLDVFWLRHAWDSAQLRRWAPDARIWADIGAGAGFPGLVLATLLKTIPGVHIHLIESMTKRCRFLSDVVQRLSLPAVVHNIRAEHAELQQVDVVTARACAPLGRLLEFAEPLLKHGALGLFLKGKDVEAEIAAAKTNWVFKSELFPSLSEGAGHIVKVEGLRRAK